MESYISLTSELMVLRETCTIKPLMLDSIVISLVKHLESSKIYWIKALHNRATKICSSNKLLNDQINRIKTFMSWNSYPKYIRKSIIKLSRHKKKSVQKDNESVIKIWIHLLYLGNKGEEPVKRQACVS